MGAHSLKLYVVLALLGVYGGRYGHGYSYGVGGYGGHGGNGLAGQYGGYGGGYGSSYNGKSYTKKTYNPDAHLYATKHKIDRYLDKSYLLGSKRLNVEVDYLNTPLEYQYLQQYHGFGHPLAHTSLGERFGLGYGSQNAYGHGGYGSAGINGYSGYNQGYGAYNDHSYGNAPYGGAYNDHAYGNAGYGTYNHGYGSAGYGGYNRANGNAVQGYGGHNNRVYGNGKVRSNTGRYQVGANNQATTRGVPVSNHGQGNMGQGYGGDRSAQAYSTTRPVNVAKNYDTLTGAETYTSRYANAAHTYGGYGNVHAQSNAGHVQLAGNEQGAVTGGYGTTAYGGYGNVKGYVHVAGNEQGATTGEIRASADGANTIQ